MNIADFLLGPAKAGYMVAVVGERAPRFVHVADTVPAARDAAINEAERLLKMAGRGRALVLRLEAVVDQPAAEFPPATVNRCTPPAVELSLETMTTIGLKLARVRELEARLAAEDPDFREVGPASGPVSTAPVADEARVEEELVREKPAPAPLVVREHGIYECRDGKIVGPARMGAFGPTIDGQIYHPTGEVIRGRSRPADLVREIVVGEGWKPWNGGIMVVGDDGKVDIVTRQCAAGLGPIVRNCVAFTLRWSHEGKSDDILAYREA